jgi:signal transduction histidine kinase
VGRDVKKKLEPRFESIVAHLADAVLVFDGEGCCYANQSAAALLHVPSTEVLGRPWVELLPGAKALFAAAFVRVASGSSLHELVELRDNERWLEARLAPVEGGVLVMLRDVTGFREPLHRADEERVRLRAEREVARRASDEANALRERLLGIVSHDLRNPVAAVIMATNGLLRRDSLVERDRRLVAGIAASGERMNRMIGQLLDFVRIRQGGGLGIVPRAGDLGSICRQVIDEIALAQPECEIALEAAGDTRGTWDDDRLAQALSNLVGNAVQHGAGERVTVQLAIAVEHLSVAVHNRGEPIPGDLLPYIFDPFRRARVLVERARSHSIGLGLFISREIAQAHGGTLEVRSPDRDGTTFTLRVPRHAHPALPPANR